MSRALVLPLVQVRGVDVESCIQEAIRLHEKLSVDITFMYNGYEFTITEQSNFDNELYRYETN